MSNCQVFYSGDNTEYANWDAFAAQYPTATIASGQLPFVITDQPFEGNIYDFTFTKS